MSPTAAASASPRRATRSRPWRAAAERAQEAGAVRADLGAVRRADDALRGRLHRRHHPEPAPEFYERIVTILLDGLRAERDGTTEMPASR